MSIPYYPFYPTDFEAKTSHLTLEEDGAYNRLLRLMWMTPGCSVPDDPAWIARRMRVDMVTYLRLVEPIINEFCSRAGGRVFQKRMQEEWKKVDETSRKRSEAGKKGGRPKAVENTEEQAKPGLSREKAGPKQPEPEPEQDKYSEANASGGQAAEDFAKQVFDRAVAFLGRNGTKESTARAFVGKLRKDHPDTAIFDAFTACSKAGAVDPIPWITARLGKPKASQDMLNQVFADLLKGPPQ